MAVVSFGSHTLLSSCLQNPSKTSNHNVHHNLSFPITHLHASKTHKLGIPNGCILAGRRCVIRPVSSKQPSIASTDEEDEEEEENNDGTTPSKVEPKQNSNLMDLLVAYKEAIRCGDEGTVEQIETKINAEKQDLVRQVSSLSEELSSGKEKYLRLQADCDNFRKRAEKERLNIRSNTQGEVVESFLLMVDNFERAKQQLILETEKEKKIDASYQGIYKQFVEIMRSLKVAAVPTVGKPFDPSLHEAISREESHEYNEGIIIQEFRRGFLLEGRLLRPAMVKVSAGPGSGATSSNDPPVDAAQPAAAAGVEGQ